MKSIIKIIATALGVMACFAVGFGWRDIRRGELPKLPGAELTADFNATQLFKQTFNHIVASYEKTVDQKDLKYAGMAGLMASLGDPHTLFLAPRDAEDFNIETRGNFSGVGARLAPDPLGARVAVIFDGGPAEKAGLKKGDIVTAVDDKSVTDIPVDKIVDRIRGPEGTVVKLRVLRAGQTKPLTIVCKRAQVTTPTVEGEVVPGTKVGHMTISGFAQPTTEQFDQTLAKLERAGINGLVVDLRSNPGGLLETATELLSRFVEDKVVIKMKSRKEREAEVRTYTGETHNFKYPIAILLNEDSASASEIFAGCMRDYKLATLVGEHSYGKASVQDIKPLVDGASAKITIARYYLPGGEDIGRKVDADGQYISGGLAPDVKVSLDPDAEVTIGDPKTDTQLQKAIQVVSRK